MTLHSSRENKISSTLLSHLSQSMVLEVGGKAYKTIARGEKDGEYLIVDIPTRSGASLPFLKNGRCIVRFLHQGMVFGFVTYMLKKVTEPVNLLILEYPQNIEEVNLRQSERVDIFLGVQIFADNNINLNGYIVDLSSQGCKIVIEETSDIVAEQNLKISFTIPPSENIEALPCFVKHCDTTDNAIQLGIMFYEKDADSLQKIEEFIKSYSKIKGKIKE